MGFVPRTDKKVFPGITINPEVCEYALKDKLVKTGEGEDDFIVIKVPYVTDRYNHDKVIQSRCEGCDMRSYIARIKNGEVLMGTHTDNFGDFTNNPQDLGEAFERAKQTEKIIDSHGKLTNDDLKELASLNNMTKAQFQAYVNNLVQTQLEKSKTDQVVANGKAAQPGVNEKKEGE